MCLFFARILNAFEHYLEDDVMSHDCFFKLIILFENSKVHKIKKLHSHKNLLQISMRKLV